MVTQVQPTMQIDSGTDFNQLVDQAIQAVRNNETLQGATTFNISDPEAEQSLREQLMGLGKPEKVQNFINNIRNMKAPAPQPATQQVAQQAPVEPQQVAGTPPATEPTQFIQQAIQQEAPKGIKVEIVPDETFRVPDPLRKEEAGAVRGLFQYPFEEQPITGAIVPREQREMEEKALLSSTLAIRSTVPPEFIQKMDNGTITEDEFEALVNSGQVWAFRPDDDLGTRYRKLLAFDSSYILDQDPETGNLTPRPTALRKEYEFYTKPKDIEGFVPGAAETARGLLVGPGGYGDMAEVDNYLKDELGLSEAARTFYMRNMARGEYVGETYGATARDVATFFPMLPSYVIQGAAFLTGDVAIPFAEFLTGLDFTEQRIREKETANRWAYDIPSWYEQKAEEIGVNPEIVEFVTRPRGAFNRTATFLAGEIPIAVAQTAYHLGGAFKTYRRFEKDLVNIYGGNTVFDALDNAFEQGKTFNEIQEQFISGYATKRAGERAARDLDTTFSFMFSLPGGRARQQTLGPVVERLQATREVIQKDLAVAVQSGDRDAIARQKIRLKQVDDEELAVRSAVLLPKWLREYTKDVRDQTIGAVTATEFAYQVFGVEEENLPFVEMAGAMAAVIPYTREIAGITGVKTQGLVTQAMYLWNKTLGDKESAEYIKSSREARIFLNHVMKDPGMREVFIAGAEQAAQLRRDLMEISQRTGADIDVDILTTSIGAMADMASLQTIARQLRDDLQVTNIADVGTNLARQQAVTERQKKTVTELSKATRRLLDLQISGELGDYPMIERMVTRLQQFVIDTGDQLVSDQRAVNELLAVENDLVSALMRGGVAYREVDGDIVPVATLDSVFDAENTNLLENGLAGTGVQIDLSTDPDIALNQLAVEFDRLRQERASLLAQAANSLRIDEAASGGAASRFASTMVATKAAVTGQANLLYKKLDADFAGARTDVADFFDAQVLGGGADFAGYVPEEVSKAALNLANLKAIPATNRGMAGVFDEAAKDSFDILRTSNNGQYAPILNGALESLGIEGEGINAWSALRKALRDPENADVLGGVFTGSREEVIAQMEEFAQSLPLLIKPSEWRLVNKHLGRVAFSSDGERKFFYTNMKQRWKDDTEFMEGWLEGQELRDVSPEFNRRFEDANEYFEWNVATRMDSDPTISKWWSAMSKSVQDAKDQADALARQGEKMPEGSKPTDWLDAVLNPVFRSPITLTGQNLYDEVGSILGKVGGVYDKASGQYRIVIDDVDDWGKTGQAVQTTLTRYLQGRLARTPGGEHILKRYKEGQPIFQPEDLEELDFNEAQFDSLFNIPVYKRDADGNLVEAGQLLNKEEVFEGISVDSLIRNRPELARTIEQAKVAFDSRKSRAFGELGKASNVVRREIKFMEETRGILGVRAAESNVFDVTKVAEGVRNLALSSPEDIGRLKNNLIKRAIADGDSPEDAAKFVDEFVQRMVVEDIYRKASSIGQDFTTQLPDGQIVKMPSIGLDGDSMLELLGREGSEEMERMRTILGDTAYENLRSIANVVRRLQDKEFPGVKGKKPGISLDSILSRVYNINRQVVSTQWVATELAIRASRQYGGRLVMTLLNDEKIAKEVLDIIETGKIPDYKREPDWLRSLHRELARVETVHNGYISEFGGDIYSGLVTPVQPPVEEPQPETQPQPQLDPQMTRLGFTRR